MAKKIKHRTKTREEREAEKLAAEEERAREAAGIDDDFQAKGFELVEWMQHNQKVVLGFLGAIVLLGAGLGIYSLSQASRDGDASKDLGEAIEIFQAEVGPSLPGLDEDALRFETAQERSDKALEKLKVVYESHAGSGAATLARLYAGHSAMQVSDYDAAIEHYGAFLSASDKSDPLYFAALSGRAAAYESKGNNEGALADYATLTDIADAPERDNALVSIARIHLAAGAKDKAKEALDRFNRDFPESGLKPTADDLLARAGGTPVPVADSNG